MRPKKYRPASPKVEACRFCRSCFGGDCLNVPRCGDAPARDGDITFGAGVTGAVGIEFRRDLKCRTRRGRFEAGDLSVDVLSMTPRRLITT